MAKGVDSGEMVTERDLNEEIAKVAYDLYIKRGMLDGYHFDDWLKAEKIVMQRYAKLKKKEIDMMVDVAKRVSTKRRQKKQ